MSTDTSILADIANLDDPRPALQTPWLTRLNDVPYAFATNGVLLLALRLMEGEHPYPEQPCGSEKFARSVHALLDDTGSDCLAASLADLRAWTAGSATRPCGACDELAAHESCPA